MTTKTSTSQSRELIFLDMWECEYVYPDGKFCRELIDKGDYCSLHSKHQNNTSESTINFISNTFRYDDYIKKLQKYCGV